MKTNVVLNSRDTLTYTQRKSIGAGEYIPRIRDKHEALPVQICNASNKDFYDGAELKPFDCRPGAMHAYSLPSRGLR